MFLISWAECLCNVTWFIRAVYLWKVVVLILLDEFCTNDTEYLPRIVLCSKHARDRENRCSRYYDQHQTKLVPFPIAVVIFDNFHHFLTFPAATYVPAHGNDSSGLYHLVTFLIYWHSYMPQNVMCTTIVAFLNAFEVPKPF